MPEGRDMPEGTGPRGGRNSAGRLRARGLAGAEERKERVLTQGTPSVVRSIADAVVLKDEDLFFLARPDGNVPLEGEHGFGLYFRDCRFLSGYELRVAGRALNDLVASAARGFRGVFQLANPELHAYGGRLIPKEQVGVRWDRVIDAEQLALDEWITFRNFGLEEIEIPATLAFRASFDDVFAVRGLLPERNGVLGAPTWEHGVLGFTYQGTDGVHRRLCIQFSPAPYAVEGTSASFRLTLRPQERTRLGVMLMVEESAQPAEAHPRAHALSDVDRIGYELQRSVDDWLGRQTRIESDSLLLNRVVERSQRDLRALRSSLDGYEYFAAGVPWFATLFGRDSLLTALQTLSCDPGPAESTLRLLALHQGREIDDYRDEQPGKILHEYRDGELARTGEIPHSPYYGTVDATPLFLVLLGRHAAWTGSLALFHELRDNVERALEWMARHGDEDGDGYIEYRSTSEKGLVNQGWKDSGDAIVEADGTLARPPIALVEVQGYAYQAKLAVAELFERAGEPERADALRGEAEQLRARFNRDFWLPELDFYALALQADARPCAVLSSNAGHALWSGIADPDKAGRTAERLMAEDLFSGWGIRTLSSRERAYNPVGYHRGTVWPHDNSLIAAGFRRYGFDAAACAIFSGLVQAAAHFAHQRLPELFAGFAQEDYGVPVRYPVACHPQAWAAGSLPFLIESLLGLRPEGFEHRLRIVRPVLPGFIDRLEVSGLRVGEGRVDLLFSRGRAGLRVEILGVQGDLEVRVEP